MHKELQQFNFKEVCCLLESSMQTHPSSQMNYFAKGAVRMLVAYGEYVFLYEHKQANWISLALDPWTALRFFQESATDRIWGYFGYDLKSVDKEFKSLNTDGVQAPDMLFFEAEMCASWSVDCVRPEYVEEWYNAEKEKEFSLHLKDEGVEQAAYEQMINKAKADIHEGRYYEINLSRQLQFHFSGSALALYDAMKNKGPVPFGSYFNLGNGIQVCSASPERFLKKEDKLLISQPIKGTAPRELNDVAKDERIKAELILSEKNKAENLMIVDLVRNDLNRVAEVGSVKVDELFGIHSFSTVHQMVSTVSAKQHPDCNFVDVIKNCFPMGSMTGAPKHEVLEAIEEYENYKRGIYSGAIGYIQQNGSFDFNVVIRTALVKKELVYYAVGGAITSDSNPTEEWQETQLKALALTNVIKKTNRKDSK